MPVKLPDTLTERHRVLAALWAMGWTSADISREYGYKEARLSILKNDPRVKLLIQEEQRKLFTRVQEGFVNRAVPFEEWMETEEEKNRKRWRELRDQDENLNVSLNAISTMWDRRYPKKQSREEEKTLRLILEKGDFGSLVNVIREVEGIVVNNTNSNNSNNNSDTDNRLEPPKIKPVQPEDIE